MQKINRAKTLKSFSDLKLPQQLITISSVEEENANIFLKAKIAHNSQLFVSGWYNESIFRLLIKNEKTPLSKSLYEKYAIALIKNSEGNYVACSIIDKEERSISVFVKPEARGQSYGSTVIEKILKETNLTNNDVYAQLGISGSAKFYSKNNIITFLTLRNYNFFVKNKIEHIYNNKQLMNDYITKEILFAKSKQNISETSVESIIHQIPSVSMSFPENNIKSHTQEPIIKKKATIS